MVNHEQILKNCKILLDAYKKGKLGQTIMPEDSNPGFSNKDKELCLTYFCLPMALNYQRDSYKLWEAVLKTFKDNDTKIIFDVKNSANLSEKQLREYLLKYKVALQPNKHITTWQTISKTIASNWGSISNLLKASNYDFLELKEILQKQFKKGFPYLS